MSALSFRRACFLLFALCAVLLAATDSQAQVERFVAGEHYRILEQHAELRPLQGVDGTPAVTEIFWYGCPGCYAFDPLLEAWVAEQGDAIAFNRVPAIYNEMTRQHARVFYTARVLGVLEEMHSAIFDSIHLQREYLVDEDAAAALFAKHGIAADSFANAFHSFSMDATLRKTGALTAALKLPQVPVLVVDGKYLVSSSPAEMLDVVEFLLSK